MGASLSSNPAILLYRVAGECGLRVLKGMGGRATGVLFAGPFPLDLFVGHCFYLPFAACVSE